MERYNELLHLLGTVEHVRGLVNPEYDLFDEHRRARVRIYDLIPYQPGRNRYDPALLMVGHKNGRVYQAPALKGATAPNKGAYVALWRASELCDYGETSVYAGVGIYAPTEPYNGGPGLITEYDEYIKPKQGQTSPQVLPDEVRVLLRRGLFTAWWDSCYSRVIATERVAV